MATRTSLSREELEALLGRFADNLNEIRQVLRSIGDAAGTVVDAIDENLAFLHHLIDEVDAQHPED